MSHVLCTCFAFASKLSSLILFLKRLPTACNSINSLDCCSVQFSSTWSFSFTATVQASILASSLSTVFISDTLSITLRSMLDCIRPGFHSNASACVGKQPCHCFDRAFLLADACVCCVKISRNKRKRQPIGMLGRSSGMLCGFRLRKRLHLNVNRALGIRYLWFQCCADPPHIIFFLPLESILVSVPRIEWPISHYCKRDSIML